MHMKTRIKYDTNCADISAREWERLTRNSTPFPERELRDMIRRDCPAIARQLMIDRPDLYNPYGDLCAETPTHYIYVHSAIEYFFRKVK